METKHTAYRQSKSLFGTASIPNIGFGSLTPNKINICSNGLESLWKHNAQLFAELGQFLGLINPKYWSVFGIPSIPNSDALVISDSSELRSKLRSKLTRFEIEVGLTRIEIKRLVFQLVVDQCSDWD